MILAAAAASRELWGEDLEFTDLAEDIAVEARLALRITEELKELDDRIDALVRERDPRGIITSAPGVGPVNGAVILGRLGDPGRFRSLAAVRSLQRPRPLARLLRHLQSPRRTHQSTAMPCSEKHYSSAQTRPADKTRPSPRNITGSWSYPANTTTPRSATSPQPCSPGSPPAGTTGLPTNSATSTAHTSPPNTRERSSGLDTPSRTRSGELAPRQERAGEARSRNALHQPARPSPRLPSTTPLDIP